MMSREMEEGNIYLVYEEQPEISMKLVGRKLTEGYRGLILSRTHPDSLRRKWNLNAPHIWLARGNTNEFIQSVHPERLMKMITIVSSFIESSDSDKIILLDGLEYLISQNGFETMMRFIQLINEQVNTSNTVMLIPLHPHALNDQQKGILEREVKVLSTDGHDSTDLNDWLSNQNR